MRRSRASMPSARGSTSQLSELEATERVLARYSKGTRTTRSKVGLNPGDQGGRPSAGTRAPPHYDRRTRRRRTHSRWLRSRAPAIRWRTPIRDGI